MQLGLAALVEVGARAECPSLPSLANADAETAPAARFGRTPAGDCSFRFADPPMARGTALVALGDSITAGQGLAPGERTWADHLVAGEPGLEVENLGHPGADICAELGTLHQRLQHGPWPRVVVWEVFADDLMSWMVYAKDGRTFAPPWIEPNDAWRWVAMHSYVGNWIWFQLLLHESSTPRLVTETQHERILARLGELRGELATADIPLIPFLIEPAGWPACTPTTRAEDACSWMGSDLVILDALFQSGGIEPLDLRGVWAGHPPVVQAGESTAKPPALVPIHPNADGHRLLAEAIRPTLEARLAGSE